MFLAGAIVVIFRHDDAVDPTQAGFPLHPGLGFVRWYLMEGGYGSRYF